VSESLADRHRALRDKALRGGQRYLPKLREQNKLTVRERLDDEGWDQFRQEIIPLLDDAYPARADGTTIFPFRRVFIVAQVGGAQRSGG